MTGVLEAHPGLVLDLRSESYVALGPAAAASYLRVVSEGATGRRVALSHFNKHAKGMFTRAVIARRGAVSEDELKAFYAAGYGEQQVLEVILGVALATLCNFSNTLAQTELNPQLADYAWTPPAA